MQVKIYNSFLSFFNSIKSFGYLLDKKDKKKAFFMFFLILIGTLLEMLSIGIIFPVIQLILNDNFANDYPSLFALKNNFNLNENQFTAYILLFLTIIFLIKNIFLFLIVIFNAKFIETLRKKISKKLHLKYLDQNYDFFIKSNTSELIRNLYQEVPKVIRGIDSILILLTEVFVLIGISVILFYISPLSTIIVIVITLILFLTYVFLTRKKFFDLGKNDQILYSSLLKETQQGYGNFKEILIYQLKNVFLYQFTNLLVKYCRNNRILSIYQQFPRMLFEQIGIFLIVGVSIFIFFLEPNKVNAIAIISIYAYAFFRLLPSINKLIVNTQMITFVRPSLDIINDEFRKKSEKEFKSEIEEPIEFKKNIDLQDVYFSAKNRKNQILKRVNLNIKKNSKIGIIGETGSGKSTLLNLIMCLIKPTSGQLKVDDKVLVNLPASWRKKISFVSQSAYLLDDTIINNITFSFNNESINEKRLNDAIDIACLKEFIDNSELKLKTIVGERGSKISGGELQRICIARAIYRESEILILDEFTSALDEKTEKKIIDNIFKLKKTIIIASHRVATLKYCDHIYEVSNNQLNKI